MKENAKKRSGSFGVLDLFILLLVVVCAAGIAVRYVLTDENGILATTPEKTSVALQVLISGIEDTSSDFFFEGASFDVGEAKETGEILDVNIKPAEYYTENEEGEIFVAYVEGEGGEKDVRCTVIVSGYYRDGIFMLGGKEPVIPGAELRLAGDGITVTALIIDTAPVDA